MRLMHLADLHIGKRVNEFSMLEDQKDILEQTLTIARKQKVDGVLIAGDVYDKAIPSVEAVSLFDAFLTKLSEQRIPVYMISGNHDSAQRISFGARLMEKSGVHVAAEYTGELKKISVRDEYGILDIYLLPFIKPAYVRAVWGEEAEKVRTYQEAVAFVMDKVVLEEAHRNLLVAHQFVTGASTCDSEEHSVGGMDQVEAACFNGFDYVALGHLHGPQTVGCDTVRYAGTLLKYSFSEVNHEKSVTIVDLKEKGNVTVEAYPVKPLHDMRKIRGTYEEVTRKSSYDHTDTEDYVQITLTDEEDVFDAVGKLRVIYPNLMRLEYDNMRTRRNVQISLYEAEEDKTPMELVEELYKLQNNKPMREEQRRYMKALITEIWEEQEQR
ncbi:MAG: exonuclease SbcCD subunit D [Lachnospiraceae bacterium]|nr:exonuclease SbcCD subunit D [Lachnospiraceae bacterium]